MGGMTHSGAQLLATRAREAPARPGVYVLLGAEQELLYIGKASNLRRRLLDHARGTTTIPDPRGERRRAQVREVRWVECADEHEALCLEADLIAGLAPALNAVMVDEAFTHICVEAVPKDRIRIRLTEDGSNGHARVYGAFPHLGKGKHSWRAVRTNGGFSAFLRLLCVASAPDDVRFRLPAKLRGSSPPTEWHAAFDPSRLPMLHDFLSGRSARMTTLLRTSATAENLPDFMRRPLLADLDAAEEFYRLGPHSLQQLRRRHGVGPGPVDRNTFARLVSHDLRQAIGDFTVPARRRSSSRVGGRLRIAT